MRVISRTPNYHFGVQAGMEIWHGPTQKQVIERDIQAVFSSSTSMHPWEIQAALRHWGKTVGWQETAFKPVGSPFGAQDVVLTPISGFPGQTLELDEMTPISPVSRFSVFDTDEFAKQENLSDEQKQALEQKLADPRWGHGVDHLVVEKPVLEPPWPAYLELRGRGGKTTADMVADKIGELGIDPRRIIEYEEYYPRVIGGEIIERMQKILAEREPAEAADELVRA